MAIQWNEHFSSNKHVAHVDKCAVQPGRKLCGASDQCLWLSREFQCRLDRTDTANDFEPADKSNDNEWQYGDFQRRCQWFDSFKLSVAPQRNEHFLGHKHVDYIDRGGSH